MGLTAHKKQQLFSWCRNDSERRQMQFMLDHTTCVQRKNIHGIFKHKNTDARIVSTRFVNIIIDPHAKGNTSPLAAIETLHDDQYASWTRVEGALDFTTVQTLLLNWTARATRAYVPQLRKETIREFIMGLQRLIVPHGYTIETMSSKTFDYGFSVSHSGHCWHFVDLEYSTTITPSEKPVAVRAGYRLSRLGATSMKAYLARADRINEVSIAESGQPIGHTVGSTATSMLQRTMRKEDVLYLPPDRLRTMLDLCWGSRGGYQYAAPFRGHASKIDRRRAYLSELAKPIPYRWGEAQAIVNGYERPGVYLCRLAGTPTLPLKIGAWNDFNEMYAPVDFYGGEVYTVLPSAEFAGYRAMGIEIEPRWGYAVTEWTSFDGFTDRMYDILRAYDGETDVLRYMKAVPNNLVGVMARGDTVRDVRWSVECPGDEWRDVLDSKGFHIPNCYERMVTSYGYKMHIDKAAWIYASNKSAMFEKSAWLHEHGHRTLYVHTDGKIYEGHVEEAAIVDEKRPGYFKDEGQDWNAKVYRAGSWEMCGIKKESGHNEPVNINIRHNINVSRIRRKTGDVSLAEMYRNVYDPTSTVSIGASLAQTVHTMYD